MITHIFSEHHTNVSLGHDGWVTSLATSKTEPDLLLSGSRDKTLIVWQLTRDGDHYGVAKKALKGHSHIVSDCALTQDGRFALSASWDKTLRLWNLETGECMRRFVGHTNDVLSVSISTSSRQFVSASRDKTVRVWNAVGKCVEVLEGHNDWVSCVRCSPTDNAVAISAGWDKAIKVSFINTISYFFCIFR